jgi:alpha-galactosidase/6-phospho-beta-glucosidase family protein
MSKEKIVILGGGNPFAPSLLYAMLENKEIVEGGEVRLMGIDPTHC